LVAGRLLWSSWLPGQTARLHVWHDGEYSISGTDFKLLALCRVLFSDAAGLRPAESRWANCFQGSSLAFFKALADANRLKIVGSLAQGPRTVEQLAALLNLQSSTVSHRLARLSKAGLVNAQAKPNGRLRQLPLQRRTLERWNGSGVRVITV
jgi:hypothetical protein